MCGPAQAHVGPRAGACGRTRRRASGRLELCLVPHAACPMREACVDTAQRRSGRALCLLAGGDGMLHAGVGALCWGRSSGALLGPGPQRAGAAGRGAAAAVRPAAAATRTRSPPRHAGSRARRPAQRGGRAGAAGSAHRCGRPSRRRRRARGRPPARGGPSSSAARARCTAAPRRAPRRRRPPPACACHKARSAAARPILLRAERLSDVTWRCCRPARHQRPSVTLERAAPPAHASRRATIR